MKAVQVTQSPTNSQRWLVTLACGHEVWMTSVRKPKNGTCRQLHDPHRRVTDQGRKVDPPRVGTTSDMGSKLPERGDLVTQTPATQAPAAEAPAPATPATPAEPKAPEPRSYRVRVRTITENDVILTATSVPEAYKLAEDAIKSGQAVEGVAIGDQELVRQTLRSATLVK